MKPMNCRNRSSDLFITKKGTVVPFSPRGGTNMKGYFVLLFLLITIFLKDGAEAESLKEGEEFRDKKGEVMRIVSSDEIEIGVGNDIFLGKYTVDGNRLRIVVATSGTTRVLYYGITSKGLKDEKTGEIYYSKEAFSVLEEKPKREEKTTTEDYWRTNPGGNIPSQEGGTHFRVQPFKKKK